MTQDLKQWHTWREIHHQPAVWRAWAQAFDLDKVRTWVDAQSFDEIWVCGAGTSAYIGDIIAAHLPGVRSVPTTDIVADPARHLTGRRPLVVSFGRSGNSAESVGTLDALDALAPTAPRLHITCNAGGALATRGSAGPLHVITLPEATHDQGFAMTSSFSTMLLTALAIFDRVPDAAERFAVLADQLDGLLPKLGGDRPSRAVYVGAGPLAFAAREAALKVMELSAGQIPALWDSSLGFRHGPKSFVLDGTRITVFVSPQAPTGRYDADLVTELRDQFPNAQVVSVGAGQDIDLPVTYSAAWAAPLFVAVAQVDAVLWSSQLGLNVDDPFIGQGTLSRVVAGVKLYEVQA